MPAHKIHFGKRVLNITEEDDKVTVHTNDNGMHVGDIVVGADGAYSAVRQRMYDRLKAKGELPKSDQEDLPFSCTCLVGQTRPLDPEKYPIIKEETCVFPTVLGKDRPFSVSIIIIFFSLNGLRYGDEGQLVFFFVCEQTTIKKKASRNGN